jgi:Cytochrome P460
MIGRTILITATFVILVLVTPHVVISPSTSQEDDKAQTAGSELITGYKSWTRVNPVPKMIPSYLAAACFIPSKEEVKMEEENPHLEKYITVYVNPVGRRSMMGQLEARYPQGSIIVKEKLTTRESKSPELLTVMIKREPGYNPGNGDWEYMALDGAGDKVRGRGKLEKCQACHKMYEGGDFVRRNYLPDEIYLKLK